MNFNVSQIGVENIFNNGFNAVSFSIIGMLIVFGGLAIISIYITLLPKILAATFHRKKISIRKKKVDDESQEKAIDTELLLAITIALHLDQTQAVGSQKLTWKRHDYGQSPWQAAGRIRGLAVRGHLYRRNQEE